MSSQKNKLNSKQLSEVSQPGTLLKILHIHNEKQLKAVASQCQYKTEKNKRSYLSYVVTLKEKRFELREQWRGKYIDVHT